MIAERPAALLACGGLTTSTVPHAAMVITHMAGLSILRKRNAPKTVILPADHHAVKVRMDTHQHLFMTQLDNAVADLAGLIPILVCQPQKTVQRDH